MDWNKAIREYGAGDNSVTDRMWYELALDICQSISGLESDNDKVTLIAVCIGASTVDPNGTVTNAHVIPFVEPAKGILNRLHSMGTAYTSRISIEYVRSELEKLLKKENIT
jgi:hypothetical protein